MSYKMLLNKKAQKDLKKYRETPYKKSLDDIFLIFKKNSFANKHSFEKLITPGKGFYSRRINVQDRIVYSVDKDSKVC